MPLSTLIISLRTIVHITRYVVYENLERKPGLPWEWEYVGIPMGKPTDFHNGMEVGITLRLWELPHVGICANSHRNPVGMEISFSRQP